MEYINISKEDLDKVDAWRKCFVDYDDEYIKTYSNSTFCPADRLLAMIYEPAKLDLYKLFGEKLILSKEIEYIVPEEEICSTLNHLSYNSPIQKFLTAIYHQNYMTTDGRFISSLFDTHDLSTNTYNRNDMILALNDGKTLKLQRGMKLSKMLQKLSESYPTLQELYEPFRIQLSQILNTRKIKGTLCLSIHPLDYMSMSDNDCDWTSCMSWRDTGSYRLGTTEMLNSSNIIVAYLTSKDNMTFYGNEWNNKKWRSLYIVNKDFIGNVKGYPYQNSTIDRTVIEWLKELAEQNWNIKYGPFTSYTYPNFANNIKLDFYTQYMYNDFGSLNKNYGVVSEEYQKILKTVGEQHTFYNEETRKYETVVRFMGQNSPLYKIEIQYSGCPQCMWCGECVFARSCEKGIEDTLLCDNCERGDSYTCEECGRGLLEDETVWVDDRCLCYDCYESLTNFDMCTHDRAVKDYLTEVYILPDKFQEETKHNIINYVNQYWQDIPIFYSSTRHHFWDNTYGTVPIYYFQDDYGEGFYYVFTESISDDSINIINSEYLYWNLTREILNFVRTPY